MPDGRKNRAGTYYTPPERLHAPSLKLLIRMSHADVYVATKDEIVAAGIATPDMFPGEPGRALTSATYRPLGIEREDGESLHLLPGYLQINRRFDGRFRVTLTVGRQAQLERRLAEQRRTERKRSGSVTGFEPSSRDAPGVREQDWRFQAFIARVCGRAAT